MRALAFAAALFAMSGVAHAQSGDPYVGTWAFQTQPYEAGQASVMALMSGVAVITDGAGDRYGAAANGAVNGAAANGPVPIEGVDVDLLVLDFDGVMTDDRVLVDQHGIESVACHRGDGWGIARLRDAGVPIVVLSTETNPVVAARCEKLRIEL